MNLMRIAMIAPLVEAVPPPLYGGTERVVSALAEELVQRGHDVTLFASGDSQTSARLVPCSPQGLRLMGVRDATPFTERQLDLAYSMEDEFDIIHNHVDWAAFSHARRAKAPTVSTMHGRLDIPELNAHYRDFPEQPLVSISDSQRAPLPDANWLATVYNGIDLAHFRYRERPGEYLVFLGRICPEKRPDRAIEIALRSDMPLVIAAKVDPVDRDYYEEEIAPLIRSYPTVEYIGEVNEREKDELLGNAYAYLFPIDWPEPFGLTMVEAMATGTPVIAMRYGSVLEVIADGVTGVVCDSVDEMVEGVAFVANLRRADCRAHAERRFSAQAMADGYERAYAALLAGDAPMSAAEAAAATAAA